MSAEAYTQEQILCGLRIIWGEVLDSEEPLKLDMRFFDEFRAGGRFEEIDFGDVTWRLQRDFGFTCALVEWKTFLGLPIQDTDVWERDIAPRLTVRALIDFIRDRLEPISLEPITLLGKPCLTAGIFRGLERLAGSVDPEVIRFGPSTPIRNCLCGLRLRCFWNRLRWIVEDQLPPPRQITLSSRGFLHSLLFKFCLGLLIAIWRRDLAGVLTGIGTTFLLLIPMGTIVSFINERLNPLPEGIETFGDLARVLAAILLDQQSEAASCSTP
ncbi:MAG: hypothetical protein ACYC3I_22850 [Gemmataceae bacterium]